MQSVEIAVVPDISNYRQAFLGNHLHQSLQEARSAHAARKHNNHTEPLSIKAYYQVAQRKPFAALWVRRGVPDSKHGLGNQPRIQVERIAHDFRTKERRAHPTGI